MSKNGGLESKRIRQSIHWMWGQYRRDLVNVSESQDSVQELSRQLVDDMRRGKITPRAAAGKLLQITD